MKNYLQGWEEASFFIDSLTRNDAKKFKLKHGEGKCPPGEHLVVREGENPFCRKSQGRENEPVKPKKSNLGVILGTSIGGGLLLAGGATAITVTGSKGNSSSNSKTNPTNPKTNPPSTTVTPDDYRRWADEEKEAGSKAEKTVTEKPKTESTKPPSATIKPDPATNSTSPATAEPKKQSTTPPTKTEPKTPTKQNPVTSNTENAKVKPPSATIKPNKQETSQNPKTSISTGTSTQSPATTNTKPKESKTTASATIKPDIPPENPVQKEVENNVITNKNKDNSIKNISGKEKQTEKTEAEIKWAKFEEEIAKEAEEKKARDELEKQEQEKKQNQKGQILRQEDGIPFVRSLNNDPSLYGATFTDTEDGRSIEGRSLRKSAEALVKNLPNKKEIIRKMIDSYKKAEERFNSTDKTNIPIGQRFSHFFLEEMGMTDKPQNVSSDIIDKEVKEGAFQLYRGIQLEDNEQMRFAQEQYRNGDYYVGDGIFGKGTYWAIGDDEAIAGAKKYATKEQNWNKENIVNFENKGKNRAINRGAIDRTAKLVTPMMLDEIAIAMDDLLYQAEEFGLTKSDAGIFKKIFAGAIAQRPVERQIGPEVIASALGFDGIVWCDRSKGMQQVNLFNRSKLLLDKETYYV